MRRHDPNAQLRIDIAETSPKFLRLVSALRWFVAHTRPRTGEKARRALPATRHRSDAPLLPSPRTSIAARRSCFRTALPGYVFPLEPGQKYSVRQNDLVANSPRRVRSGNASPAKVGRYSPGHGNGFGSAAGPLHRRGHARAHQSRTAARRRGLGEPSYGRPPCCCALGLISSGGGSQASTPTCSNPLSQRNGWKMPNA